MLSDDSKAYHWIKNPLVQAGLTFGLIFLVSIIGLGIGATGLTEVSHMFPWLTAASLLLFFAMINCFISLSLENPGDYWSRSILSFTGLAVACALLCWLLSGVTILDAGSYLWIYIVVSISYLIFLGMMRFMRRVVEFAQREVWNQPKRRRKPR